MTPFYRPENRGSGKFDCLRWGSKLLSVWAGRAVGLRGLSGAHPTPCGRPEPRPPAGLSLNVKGGGSGWLRCLPLTDGKPEGAGTDHLSLSRSHAAAVAAATSLPNCWGRPSPWQPPEASWPQVQGGTVATLSPGPGALWPLDDASGLEASGSHQP